MTPPKKLAEAFQIFAKYSDKKYPLDAEYEEIKIWINPEKVEEKDKEKLDEIGFHAKQKSRHQPHFYYYT